MKRAFLLLLFLLLIPFVVADDLSFVFFYPDYAPGESVQVQLPLFVNLSQGITAEDVSLYSLSGERIPVSRTVTRINPQEYTLSFDLPASLAAGEYTLSLGPLYYMEGTTAYKGAFNTTFKVVNVSSFLSFAPGFFYREGLGNLDQPTFYFSVFNPTNASLNLSFNGSSFLSVHPSSAGVAPMKSVSVQINTHLVDQPSFPYYLGDVFIVGLPERSYHLPVLLTRDSFSGVPSYFLNGTNNSVDIPVKEKTVFLESLRVNLSEFTLAVSLNQTQSFLVHFPVQNMGTKTVHGLQFSVSPEVASLFSLQVASLPSLEPGEEYDVTAFLNTQKNFTTSTAGEFVVVARDTMSLHYPIQLTFVKPPLQIPVLQNKTENVTVVHVVQPPASSFPWIWVIAISIIVLGLGGFFYLYWKQHRNYY